MVDDEWDWDHGEIVDLDITGDPQLDQMGYQSPRRNFSPPHKEVDWLAQSQRDQEEIRRKREAVAQNKADTRRRNAERRGQPDLPPHVTQAVEHGWLGHAPGWYRLDVTPDGSATWTKADAPTDDGNPRVMVAAARPRRRWWQRRRPDEPQPSPGTQIW